MDIVTGSILAKSCVEDIFDQYYEQQDNLINKDELVETYAK